MTATDRRDHHVGGKVHWLNLPRRIFPLQGTLISTLSAKSRSNGARWVFGHPKPQICNFFPRKIHFFRIGEQAFERQLPDFCRRHSFIVWTLTTNVCNVSQLWLNFDTPNGCLIKLLNVWHFRTLVPRGIFPGITIFAWLSSTLRWLAQWLPYRIRLSCHRQICLYFYCIAQSFLFLSA